MKRILLGLTLLLAAAMFFGAQPASAASLTDARLLGKTAGDGVIEVQGYGGGGSYGGGYSEGYSKRDRYYDDGDDDNDYGYRRRYNYSYRYSRDHDAQFSRGRDWCYGCAERCYEGYCPRRCYGWERYCRHDDY